MIILNGNKFAKNDSEFTDSLFTPGGTCVGYYKANRCSVYLLNMQKERVGVINKNGVLGSATKTKEGNWWYSYATIPEVGEYDSYMQSVTEPESILRELTA